MPITNNPVPLGKLTVAAAGTPVAVLANFASDPEISKLSVNKFEVTAPPTGNTGNVYLGYANMNKTTLAGVIAIITPSQPYKFQDNQGGNVLDLTKLYVDADTNGNYVLAVGHVR